MRKDRKLRILHVTNWYPGDENPYDALWIKRQIESLNPFYENYVLHIQVIPSSGLSWKETKLDEGIQFVMKIPFQQWAIVEILTYAILCKWLKRLNVNEDFDVVDFHIAYPLLTYWHRLKRSISIPVVLNEHWSAYHYFFNVTRMDKLRRIKKIFSHKLPMVVVSRALANDVRIFSGQDDIQFFVVPNAVNVSVFRKAGPRSRLSFFMLSLWKYPKQPLVAIEAFGTFIRKNRLESLELRIGGYGPLSVEMTEFVQLNNLQKNVIFLGRLDAQAIVAAMNESIAFIHCSDYETFSVVCAEALCCGTPVITSAVGGLREFVTEKNGVLVNDNTPEAWVRALDSFWVKQADFEEHEICREAQSFFSMHSVGKQYAQVVRKIHDKTDNHISSHT